MSDTQIGIQLQAFNTAIPSGATAESLHDYLHFTSGEPITQASYAIDGNGAQTDNIFTVTGTILILSIHLDITAVADSTTFSGVKFALYDSTATVDITGTVDGSGCLAGAQFVKTSDKGSALTFIDNSVGVVTEGNAGPPPQVGIDIPFYATKKSGANTFIQLVFTGDANTDITANICARYYPISSDGALAAV